MALSIGNIAIWVKDLSRAVAFYTEGLGLDVLATIESPDVREVIVGRRDVGCQLMLAVRTDQQPPPAPAGMWKVFLSSDDVAADWSRAIAAGARPIAEPARLERFAITIGLLEDPDGYLLELGQRHVSP